MDDQSQVDSTAVGTPIESDIAYLDAIVPKMRALGVMRFGELELGPVPLSDAADDVERATQRIPTAQQLEQRAREERRRVASAASGGPIRRVADQ